MSDAQLRSRRQERIEQLCAAAIRAISGVGDVHFRGRRLHRGKRPLPLYAPHLSVSLDADDFASFRGAADGYGLVYVFPVGEFTRVTEALRSAPVTDRRGLPDTARQYTRSQR